MEVDPLAFSAADSNLFRYTGNSPTNGTDPLGLLYISINFCFGPIPISAIGPIPVLVAGSLCFAIHIPVVFQLGWPPIVFGPPSGGYVGGGVMIGLGFISGSITYGPGAGGFGIPPNCQFGAIGVFACIPVPIPGTAAWIPFAFEAIFPTGPIIPPFPPMPPPVVVNPGLGYGAGIAITAGMIF